MKKKEPLSPKEENFCRFFVASREPRASAARAGYSLHPERTAIKEEIRAYLMSQYDDWEEDALVYRKLPYLPQAGQGD